MPSAPYYHIGIVVHNYEEAVAHYSNILGVKFAEPSDSVLCIENPQTQQTKA